MSAALITVFAACSGGDSAEAPAAAPPPAAEPAAAEPAAEEPPAEEAGGGACEAYARCCSDYVDALGSVAGMEGAVGAAKLSCDQIAGMKGLPGADDGCQQALDGMKQAMEAYKAMPGFNVPGSCT
jgi:hypothetical protein